MRSGSYLNPCSLQYPHLSMGTARSYTYPARSHRSVWRVAWRITNLWRYILRVDISTVIIIKWVMRSMVLVTRMPIGNISKLVPWPHDHACHQRYRCRTPTHDTIYTICRLTIVHVMFIMFVSWWVCGTQAITTTRLHTFKLTVGISSFHNRPSLISCCIRTAQVLAIVKIT